MGKTTNTFFCSDLHAYHSNICLGTSKWPNKDENCRSFNTIEEMNSTIIKSINSVVSKDDILYHLGDWSFGGFENIWNLRKQIACENIIQINGNHDKFFKKNTLIPNLKKDLGIIFETNELINDNNEVRVCDLFSEVHDGRLTRCINGQYIVMDHYPYEDWENSETGTWMLHGHLHHGSDNNPISLKYKRFDVGWDGKVYSFDELKSIMDKRENKFRH